MQAPAALLCAKCGEAADGWTCAICGSVARDHDPGHLHVGSDAKDGSGGGIVTVRDFHIIHESPGLALTARRRAWAAWLAETEPWAQPSLGCRPSRPWPAVPDHSAGAGFDLEGSRTGLPTHRHSASAGLA